MKAILLSDWVHGLRARLRILSLCSAALAPLLVVAVRAPASEALPALQRLIAAREYAASRNAQGLQAPNRAHNLRTYFDARGIRVVDRTAAGSPELLSLRLARAGRRGALRPVGPAVVTSEGARVELRRPDLIEWYENAPSGLEQGFTLAARPEGDAPLVLELSVAGARARLAGESIVFATAPGRRLAYSKLAAVDARGRVLATHFEVVDPERVRIVLADAGAAYPIEIDPLLTQTADAEIESGQLSAQLGISVAGAGDVNGDGYADVIVGAYLYDDGGADAGAAFVFHGSATGVAGGGPLDADTAIHADQAGAQFGTSVAGAGDVNGDGYADVIVGSSRYAEGQTAEGAAFVFHGGAAGSAGGGLVDAGADAQAKLQGDQAFALFGWSVAGAGDVNGDGYADVIVGAYLYDSGQTDEGAAFVFHGSATGIASTNPAGAAAQIEADQASAFLGISVAPAGDVDADGYADVIVGAHFYTDGQSAEGAAFIFHGSASGIPGGNPTNAATQLEADQAGAALGNSVAGAGDVNGDGYADVIVGAPAYDAGESDEGAAFVFHGSATGIADGGPAAAQAVLQSNQIAARLGLGVGGVGDVNGDGYADVVVGARTYDAGHSDEGAAFVFHGSADGIPSGEPATADAQLEADQAGASLGASLGSAGDVNGDGYADLIVGAYLYDGAQADEGAAFVFHGGANGIADGNPATAHARLESDEVDAALGDSVAGAGDVNGDGYADLIVGAPGFDAGGADAGAAFVFHGGAAGVADGNPASADSMLQSDQAGARLGESVASAGDVDGDGYADVIVGAPAYDAGESNEGAAFLFHGSAAGIADGGPATAQTVLQSDQAGAGFGHSVAQAGDVNGDGYADVIVGAYLYDAGQTNEGAAFVFHGGVLGVPHGGPATADALLQSDQIDARMGSSVAGAGDVDADGYADVIVGAHRYDAVEIDEGAAFVFRGAAAGVSSGSPATADAQLESDQASAQLGISVAGAGDVNGDAYGDVIVGSHLYDAGQANEGSAFVFHGGAAGIPSGSPATAAARLEGDQIGAWLGRSVSGAGDVNGDGYADVIAGAALYDAGQLDEGAAFVFLGGPAGIPHGGPATAGAQLESDQPGAQLGGAVAGAGDLNGDGYADVVVGAPLYAGAESGEGSALVFLGNGDAQGRPVVAQQLRADGSGTPVQSWGSSLAVDAFQVSLVATHPAGRGRVKLEVEACPPGAPFGDAGCASQVSASWIEVGPPGAAVNLVQTLSGLSAGSLYRWRARVLHAPLTLTQPGISAPPAPAHGPWRRVSAQVVEADIRPAPEPGILVGLMAGAAVLALLAPGRRQR